MKANEIRRKFKFLITGMILSAMVASMAACSSASTGSTSGSAQAAAETTAGWSREQIRGDGIRGQYFRGRGRGRNCCGCLRNCCICLRAGRSCQGRY